METAKNRKRSVLTAIFFVVSMMVLIIGALTWFGMTVQCSRIGGKYMSPTLEENNLVVVNLTAYREGRPISRGDVVMLFPPNVSVPPESLDFSPIAVLNRAAAPPRLSDSGSSIKRVVGLPGDRLTVNEKGVLLVNGKNREEPYVVHKANYKLSTVGDIGGELSSTHSLIAPYSGLDAPITVPPYSVFVLGDNRSDSEDSHIYGFVSQDRVIGKVTCRFFPLFKLID